MRYRIATVCLIVMLITTVFQISLVSANRAKGDLEGQQGVGSPDIGACEYGACYVFLPLVIRNNPSDIPMPTPTPTPTDTTVPTDTPGPTATFTAVPTDTPTSVPSEVYPIKVELQNYLDHEDELVGSGPFYIYAWLSDSQIEEFDTKVRQLAQIADPDVTKKILLLSSAVNLDGKLNQQQGTMYTPEQLRGFGITSVLYNSEPSLSLDYNDIFSENQNNSVVRFVNIAKAHGLEAYWGPLRGNVDSHASPSVRVSDAALSLMFDAGLDGIVLQEQRQIGSSCIENIVWGPHSIGGGRPADCVSETVTHLRQVAGRDFEIIVHIMPGYQDDHGCHPGDAYAVANCGLELAYTYQHCHNFAAELWASGLADSMSIWAMAPNDRTQVVNLVQAIRR